MNGEETGREPQIAREMKMLDKRLLSLEECVKQHEVRIGQVLSPILPSKEITDAIKGNPKAPLAESLSSFCDRVEAIEARIIDISQRTEL